jgi:hypothetical protein
MQVCLADAEQPFYTPPFYAPPEIPDYPVTLYEKMNIFYTL